MSKPEPACFASKFSPVQTSPMHLWLHLQRRGDQAFLKTAGSVAEPLCCSCTQFSHQRVLLLFWVHSGICSNKSLQPFLFICLLVGSLLSAYNWYLLTFVQIYVDSCDQSSFTPCELTGDGALPSPGAHAQDNDDAGSELSWSQDPAAEAARPKPLGMFCCSPVFPSYCQLPFTVFQRAG